MAKGGKRPGAGRPKGSQNKASVARQEAIAASGLTPLDFMLSVVRDEDEDRPVRMKAAADAAPYVHPKLQAIQHTGKDGGPIETADISGTELARKVAFILTQGVKKNED